MSDSSHQQSSGPSSTQDALAPHTPAPQASPAGNIDRFISHPFRVLQESLKRFFTYGFKQFAIWTILTALVIFGVTILLAFIGGFLVGLFGAIGIALIFLFLLPAYVLILFLSMFMYAGQLRISAEAANRTTVTYKQAYATAKQKVWGLTAVSILSGLAVGFGFLFFIIPGIFLLIRLLFAPYIYVMEGRGVIDSLTESWNRTENYFWHITGAVILAMAIGIGLVLIASGLELIPSLFIDEENAATSAIGIVLFIIFYILSILASLLSQLFYVAVSAFHYLQRNLVAVGRIQKPERTDPLNYVVVGITGGLLLFFIIALVAIAVITAVTSSTHGGFDSPSGDSPYEYQMPRETDFFNSGDSSFN